MAPTVDLALRWVYPTRMTAIVFLAQDGTRYDIEAANGSSAMENAVRHDVPGIDADCGGACACATCHVYVEEAFLPLLPEMEAMEEDMLDFAIDVRANSRLSCQIRIRPELEGLTLRVPERQP
jgi:2Fe-2S ferredoxin